eukprot:1265491-Pyramimonas_sp.AAC.1
MASTEVLNTLRSTKCFRMDPSSEVDRVFRFVPVKHVLRFFCTRFSATLGCWSTLAVIDTGGPLRCSRIDYSAPGSPQRGARR